MSCFDEIPEGLRGGDLSALGLGVGEAALLRQMAERAAGDGAALSFIGAARISITCRLPSGI